MQQKGTIAHKETTIHYQALEAHCFLMNSFWSYSTEAFLITPRAMILPMLRSPRYCLLVSVHIKDSKYFTNVTLLDIHLIHLPRSMQSLLNPLPGDSNLILLPELTREDADVTLISFFPSNMTYKQPVEDPIFSAHRPIEIETTFDEQRRYQSDYDFGIMGCAEQVST
jgi:hypothetical protein